ncbi:pentapeptide repeat-containing protein, partial [Mesorhizobium sp. M0228]
EAYRTDFSRMDAQGAVFASAEMQRSNFQGANLTNVDFTKAELGRAQFHDADISGSRFSFANLARADFRGATFTAPVDFDRAFLFLTRIEGLDLSNSVGLSQWQLNMACGDARTELTSGLTRPEDWPCQFQQE